MKKRIFAIAVIAICLSILATTTLAYYTATDVARSAITSDGIDINIEEFKADGSAYPTGAVKVMPSTEVDKVVHIRNLDRDSFVRAQIILTMKKDGKVTDFDPSLVTITMGSSKWLPKEGSEGWWYYDAVLGPGGLTEPLMTKVSFSSQMGNAYQGCTFEVTILSQAVQADHNGTSVLEALGWPGEPLPAPVVPEE